MKLISQGFIVRFISFHVNVIVIELLSYYLSVCKIPKYSDILASFSKSTCFLDLWTEENHLDSDHSAFIRAFGLGF